MSLRECFEGALRITAVLAAIFGGGAVMLWCATLASGFGGVVGFVLPIVICVIGVIAIAFVVVSAMAWEKEENR